MTYNKYNKQLDSEIEWVGMVPSHWTKSKFKHNFIFSKSTNNSKNPTILSLTQQGIKIRDISTNEGQIASSYDDYTKVYKKDIVLNPMDLISGFVDCSPVEGVISPAYFTLKPNKDINPEYYKYYLQKHYYERIFFPFGEGVSVDHRWTLKKEDFLNFSLIKPPIDEQTQIANYLDKQTAKIDEVILKNKLLIDLLEEKRIALINQIITKGLNPEVPMKDSGIEWIGKIPENWEIIKIKYCTELINDKKDFADINDKYVGLEHIESETGKLLKYSDEGADGTVNKFKKGMVLFGKLRPYLAKVINTTFDGVCSTELLVFKTKPSVLPNYLFYMMLSNRFIEQVNSSTYGVKMPRASPEFINSLPITIPDLSEQKQIVSYLDSKISSINGIIIKIKENIKLLEEYKTSLIHHVVTGKIDVRGEEI